MTPAQLAETIQVLAFDPGTHETAWASTAVTGRRVKYLDSGMVASNLDALAHLLSFMPNALVAVEIPDGGVYEAFRASGLMVTCTVAGWIEGLIHGQRRLLARLPAADWRKSMVMGARRSEERDKIVERVVRQIVQGMPARTNPHVRDALGLTVDVAFRRVTGQPLLCDPAARDEERRMKARAKRNARKSLLARAGGAR